MTKNKAPVSRARREPKALKEVDKISKMIVELEEYEREVLYPLAIKQVKIDLDDGVNAVHAGAVERLSRAQEVVI